MYPLLHCIGCVLEESSGEESQEKCMDGLLRIIGKWLLLEYLPDRLINPDEYEEEDLTDPVAVQVKDKLYKV